MFLCCRCSVGGGKCSWTNHSEGETAMMGKNKMIINVNLRLKLAYTGEPASCGLFSCLNLMLPHPNCKMNVQSTCSLQCS